MTETFEIQINDPVQALRQIWDVLGAYQDDSIPFEKYQEMADDCREMEEFGNAEIYQDTADAYRAEWDEICHAMAVITEALDIDAEDAS